jgi:hypothetical protein
VLVPWKHGFGLAIGWRLFDLEGRTKLVDPALQCFFRLGSAGGLTRALAYDDNIFDDTAWSQVSEIDLVMERPGTRNPPSPPNRRSKRSANNYVVDGVLDQNCDRTPNDYRVLRVNGRDCNENRRT